jgi:hypothetical protein
MVETAGSMMCFSFWCGDTSCTTFLAGMFETEISNERLPCTLTSASFRLAAALAAQVAKGFAPEGAPGAAGGPANGPAASSGCGPAVAAAAPSPRAPVHVMEGVQEDAYRCAPSYLGFHAVQVPQCACKGGSRPDLHCIRSTKARQHFKLNADGRQSMIEQEAVEGR